MQFLATLCVAGLFAFARSDLITIDYFARRGCISEGAATSSIRVGDLECQHNAYSATPGGSWEVSSLGDGVVVALYFSDDSICSQVRSVRYVVPGWLFAYTKP